MQNKNAWSAPQKKQIKSVDISAVIYKPQRKEDKYIRSSTYRKQASISLKGTNAEIY